MGWIISLVLVAGCIFNGNVIDQNAVILVAAGLFAIAGSISFHK